MSARVRVIGCGNPEAGDDAVGLLAVGLARRRLPPEVEVVQAGASVRVLDLLEDVDAVVIADAVRTPSGGRGPGTIVRAVGDAGGLSSELRNSLSSHGLGLAEAVGLAAVMGPLPRVDVRRRRGRRSHGGPWTVSRGGLGAARARRRDRARGRRDGGGPRVNAVEARRIEVHGVVQGVGFRPFVWRLAARHGIHGRVRNASGVVEIHAEGSVEALDAFATAIATDAPPLAQVDTVAWAPTDLEGLAGFAVDASVDGDGERLVSPDAATCAACLAELFDPADRRYRYPFINCTDCGPRFTIISSLPYDRERTSMRAFPMCDDCRREYEDPADRRFHAEPVACPACGPRLWVDGRRRGSDRDRGGMPSRRGGPRAQGPRRVPPRLRRHRRGRGRPVARAEAPAR